MKRFKLKRDGRWRNLKYYLLTGVLIGSLSGVLLTGFVAAMPVITRGLQFMVAPIQTGLLRGWHQVPPPDAGHYLSIGLFILILLLGLLGRRFWCRYVCPTGAVFSIASLVLRLTERKVEDSCIDCNKCVEVCPFDAIKADYTTRTMDCTFCRTCGGVCPTHSIKFVGRWNMRDLKPEGKPLMREASASRRGFLVAAASGLASALLIKRVFSAGLDSAGTLKLPLRPPGSVPERDFLALCIRCGECYKVCPNNALQPLRFQQGLEGVWTPYVAANWSGCEPSCNNCGQVCPTGAIRAISLAKKRSARIGLAVVDKSACLPWAEKDACRLCADECSAAGYHAIEFERVGVQLDEDGFPVEDSGFSAPVILAEKCVGCGLCQSVCFRINKKVKGRLRDTAVRTISLQTS